MENRGRREQGPLELPEPEPAVSQPDLGPHAPNGVLAETGQRVRTLIASLPESTPDEVADLVDQVVAHVAFFYPVLRLDRLVSHPRWPTYIDRQALRRYLTLLRGEPAGRWARCDDSSIPQSRTILLADIAILEPADRRAFDAIYMHGLSVRETAIVEAVEQDELVRRLRSSWASIQVKFPWLFGSRVRSTFTLKEDPA